MKTSETGANNPNSRLEDVLRRRLKYLKNPEDNDRVTYNLKKSLTEPDELLDRLESIQRMPQDYINNYKKSVPDLIFNSKIGSLKKLSRNPDLCEFLEVSKNKLGELIVHRTLNLPYSLQKFKETPESEKDMECTEKFEDPETKNETQKTLRPREIERERPKKRLRNPSVEMLSQQQQGNTK